MKNFIVCIALLTSFCSEGQIRRVSHFTINSPHASELNDLFRNSFGLPSLWEFSRLGDFGSSGGVTLGNVMLEFAKYKNTTITEFGEIGLEPRQPVQQMIPVLDKAKVKHGAVETNGSGSMIYRSKMDSSLLHWSIIQLREVIPDVNFLVVSFTERQWVVDMRQKAEDALLRLKGGSLGIVNVKQIVIGCKNLELSKNSLSKIPGVRKHGNDVFTFDEGPAIRLINKDKQGIAKVVLKTSSLETAKRYLQQQNMLGDATKDQVAIRHPLINGVQIELVEH